MVSSARVLKVIPPNPSLKSPSPVKVPVLSPVKVVPPPCKLTSDTEPAQETVTCSQSPTANGLPSSDSSQDFTEPTPKTKSPRTPRTPLTPLSAEVNLRPADYLYVVALVESPELKLQVPPKQLRYAVGRLLWYVVSTPPYNLCSRPKGAFVPRKLKLFLRNALVHPSEKYPLMVKVGPYLLFC